MKNRRNKNQIAWIYYNKYDEYNICYKVDCCGFNINLAEISTKLNKVFPECRESYRFAIVELDRVLKIHYKMEELLKELLPHQSGKTAQRINELLNVKGDEK